MARQGNVQFVPCMCPVAVSVSPDVAEKRMDEGEDNLLGTLPASELDSFSPSLTQSSPIQTSDDETL